MRCVAELSRRLGSLAQILICAFALSSLAGSRGAYAEPGSTTYRYPTLPINIVVPWPAGGGPDLVTRALAKEMEASLRQTIIIENRPGATGAIAMAQVRRAAPDGHTIVVVNSATHAYQPVVSKTLPYDAFADFEPIGQFGYFPFGLLVRSTLPIKNLPEFLAYSKDRKDGLLIGVPGTNSIAHFFGKMIAEQTGANITFVPYPGDVAAQRDLLGDHIAGTFGTVNFGLVREGKARLLVSSGPSRWKQAPDSPTLGESGFANLVAVIVWGFAAPVGTPSAAIEVLNNALQKAVNSSSVIRAMDEFGYFPVVGAPQDLWKAFESDKSRFMHFKADKSHAGE